MSNDRKSRPMRWWPLALIVILAAASFVRLRLSTDLESNFKNMYEFLTGGLAILLLLVWFFFFSRLRWRTRLTGLALFVLAVLGVSQLVRFDGTDDGTGTFRVVWKWTPMRDGNVGDFKPALGATNQPMLAAPSDYPGYLGHDRRGVVENLPLDRDWSAHPPQQLWRHPVGLGWSAFAVARSSAITQEQRGERELVVCYELATGRAVWAHTNLVRFSENMGGDGPRATPTIADGRVYTLGATGILDCLDAANGQLHWSKDTLNENGLPNLIWAKSSSPLVFDNLVVVSGGLTNGPTLLAYRREDGSSAWRAGTDKASYSSPALARLGGKRLILSVNAASVTGHDAEDGHILWQYPWGTDKWPKCAQPVVLEGDRVFVSAGYGVGCALLQVQTSADGKFSVTELWKNRNMKSQFSNLVVHDGFVYGLDDGILACVDLAMGERMWKDGRYGHGQVLLAGDVLLVQTEPGPVVLVEAKPGAYREIAKLNALSSKTWNTPVIAGAFLLARNDQEAVCYKLSLSQSSHATASPTADSQAGTTRTAARVN